MERGWLSNTDLMCAKRADEGGENGEAEQFLGGKDQTGPSSGKSNRGRRAKSPRNDVRHDGDIQKTAREIGWRAESARGRSRKNPNYIRYVKGRRGDPQWGKWIEIRHRQQSLSFPISQARRSVEGFGAV